jgi:hypothetical protein
VRLERPLGIDADALRGCSKWLAPLVLVPGTTRLYAQTTIDCGTPGSNSTTLLASKDQGSNWTPAVSLYTAGYGGGTRSFSVSPVDPHDVYALFDNGGGVVTQALASTDGGVTWPVRTSLLPPGPANAAFATTIVADPQKAGVAYVNFAANAKPTTVARTLDGGRT